MIAVPRSERPRASIVICASRNAGNLRDCLASLESGCEGVAGETVVVLNGADDAVTALVRDEVRGATVIEAPLNIGFAAGNNVGRSAARGEHLVLLHDDAVACPGWLAPLVETADAHPEAGAVGSLALWPDGRVQAAGAVIWRGGEWTIAGDGDPPDAHRELRAVASTSGCGLLVRTADFDAAGGFDHTLYPAGWVDQTLLLSIRRLGRAVLLDPRSRLVHRRSRAVGRDGEYRSWVYERNRTRFLERFSSDLAVLPPKPDDPGELAGAMAEAHRRLDADWRRLTSEPREPPPAPPVRGPFAPDAPRAERVEHSLFYLERERELRAEWDRHLLDHVARVEADNAALRISRDEAVAYARSLEAERAGRP